MMWQRQLIKVCECGIVLDRINNFCNILGLRRDMCCISLQYAILSVDAVSMKFWLEFLWF